MGSHHRQINKNRYPQAGQTCNGPNVMLPVSGNQHCNVQSIEEDSMERHAMEYVIDVFAYEVGGHA